MAINYKISKCKNPNGVEGVDYFVNRAVKVDDYTMERLIEDINDATGMSDIDVRGVLSALNKQIRKSLLDGRTVVLEGVGRLSVGIRSKCFTQEDMDADEFNPSSKIKEVHINFRPAPSIVKELRMKKSLRRVSSEAME